MTDEPRDPLDPRPVDPAAPQDADTQAGLAAGAAAEIAAPADALDADEVRRRAAGGAATLGVRNVVIVILGLAGNLALARLLAPRDFGLVALGTTLLIVGRLLSDGGVGLALIGRERPPERRELEAVLGVQLVGSVVFVAVGFALAVPFGEDGLVPAVMLLALPLTTFRTPPAIVLERQLAFRVIGTSDAAEAATNYAWAVLLVALGAGVWGLATAAIARSLVGAVLMISLGPLGFVVPRPSLSIVRPILGFGVRVQAVSLVLLARDQGLNVGIAAIAGVATLGIWSLAWRILQLPLLVFTSMSRVTYPAMARLGGNPDAQRGALERGVGVVAIATVVITVGMTAGAPSLVPVLLGDRWGAVPGVLVWSAIGLSLSAPMASASIGYLLATGQAQAVLIGAAASGTAWVAVGLALLEPVGIEAIGLGWIAAAAVEIVLIGGAAARRTGARLLKNLLAPVAVGGVAGACGWAIASAGEPSVLAGAGGVLAAEALLLAGLLLVLPSLTRESARMLRLAAAQVGVR